MKKEHFLLIVALVIILSAIFLRIKPRIDDQNSLSKIEKSTASSVVVVEDDNVMEYNNEQVSDSIEVIPVDPPNKSNLLISAPESGQLISSPLVIKGRVSGSWFFEASLPISLVDSNDLVIAKHYVSADGEWMTSNPVSFSGEISFTINEETTDSGYLIIHKNNPSGLSENDGAIKMPIRFR